MIYACNILYFFINSDPNLFRSGMKHDYIDCTSNGSSNCMFYIGHFDAINCKVLLNLINLDFMRQLNQLHKRSRFLVHLICIDMYNVGNTFSTFCGIDMWDQPAMWTLFKATHDIFLSQFNLFPHIYYFPFTVNNILW